MKNPFQIGDRVAYYESNPVRRSAGVIIEVFIDGKICISSDSHIAMVHSKQCRRLIKKKRREIFIDSTDFSKISHNLFRSAIITITNYAQTENCVKFIEAKK